MDALDHEQDIIAIQHPLENQVILDLVLAYLQPLATFKDWKSIRTVSKTWYFQTLSKWRASAVLNLKLGEPRKQNKSEIPGVYELAKFLALTENEMSDFCQLTEKPFRKYKIQNLVLDVFNVKTNKLFWASVGPSIRHLSLHEVKIETRTNSMREIMEFLVNQIPNLDSFALNNVKIDRKQINKPPKITVLHPHVKKLRISNCFAFGFTNFPNLQEVTLVSCDSEHITKLVDPNPPAIGRIANFSVQRLKLEDCCIYTSEVLRVRFTALKHVSLSKYFEFDENFSVLSDFITNHGETLQTIDAFGSFRNVSRSYIFIRESLPNLTELRSWGTLFPNLTFIQDTQSLKLLHLDLYGYEKQEEMREYLSACQSNERWHLLQWDQVDFTHSIIRGLDVMNHVWQHMHYFQINYELKEDTFNRLANWLPNLKTLKTVLNKDTFSVACENWPKLEHLDFMFGSSILNENITGTDLGLSEGECNKALVDMEHLTTFKLLTECNKSLLSDDCVATGFVRVPKLTDLSICVSPEFSQAAEALLGRGIRNIKVCRNYSSNPLHDHWQCCRDREYKNFLFTPEEDNITEVM